MNKGCHIEQIRTYLRCPHQYLYQYYFNLRFGEFVSDQTIFYACLRQVILWFFVLAQGQSVSWSELSNRWEVFWSNIASDNDIEDSSEYLTEGLYVLNQFFWGLNSTLDVILTDCQLSLEMSGSDPVIFDIFALVRGRVTQGKTKNAEYSIVNLRNPVDPVSHFQRDGIIDRLLVRTIYSKLPEFTKDSVLRLSTFNLQSGGWQDSEIQSDIIENDFYCVNAVRRGIEAKAFFPRRDSYCNTCPFDTICDSESCASPLIDNKAKAQKFLNHCLKHGELGNVKNYNKFKQSGPVPSFREVPATDDGIIRLNSERGTIRTTT